MDCRKHGAVHLDVFDIYICIAPTAHWSIKFCLIFHYIGVGYIGVADFQTCESSFFSPILVE